MSDIKPIAWALKRSDGLVLDVICPGEHDNIVGDYTTPLYPQSAIDAQAAEIEALRRDAERWRWLRDRATSCHEQQNTPDGIHYPTTWRVVTGGSDTNIDAAIDAAMGVKP